MYPVVAVGWSVRREEEIHVRAGESCERPSLSDVFQLKVQIPTDEREV